MAFECWKCGACCKLAGFKAPELDRGDGACIHLTDDNLCSIYENRPDICVLNRERPESEQIKWCMLQEANWESYAETLRGIDRDTPGVVHSPVESDEGCSQES